MMCMYVCIYLIIYFEMNSYEVNGSKGTNSNSYVFKANKTMLIRIAMY